MEEEDGGGGGGVPTTPREKQLGSGEPPRPPHFNVGRATGEVRTKKPAPHRTLNLGGGRKTPVAFCTGLFGQIDGARRPQPGDGGAAAAAGAGGGCAPPGRGGCRAPVRGPGGERGGAAPAAPPASLCVAAAQPAPPLRARAREMIIARHYPRITRLLPGLLPAYILTITRLNALE